MATIVYLQLAAHTSLLQRARETVLVGLEDWTALAPALRVTVSVGAASATGPGSVADLYPRADAALYAAKAAGPGLLRIAH